MTYTTRTTTTTTTRVWPVLAFRDARSAIRFLGDAFGLEPVAVHPEHGPVVHAELRWPGGGGVMLSDAARPDGLLSSRPTGAASVYLVTADPDGMFDRARAAGAEVVLGLRDEDYGSRGFTVRDPEGNLWSFGTYVGAA